MYAGDLNEAEKYFKRENDLYKELVKSSDMISIRKDYAVSFRNLGKVCFEKNDYAQAKEHYSHAAELLEQIAKELNIEGKYDILAVTYRMLGDVAMSDVQLGKAKNLYQNAYDITQCIMQETNSFHAQREHSISCIKCGDVCLANNEIAAAQCLFEKAKAILEPFQTRSKSDDIARDYLICIERLGSCCYKAHEYKKAVSLYNYALEKKYRREEKLGSIGSINDVAVLLRIIGDIKKAEGDRAAALVYYMKAKEKYGIIMEKAASVSPSIRRDAALLLEIIGNEYSEDENWINAGAAYSEALDELRIIKDRANSANFLRDYIEILEKVGDTQSQMGNLKEAEDAYSEALEKHRNLEEGTDPLAALCPLARLIEKLGNIRHDNGDDEGAEKCFEEGAEAFEKVADITGAAGDKREVAYCLLMLGETKAKRDPDGAYQYMLEACKKFKKLTEFYNEKWAYEDLAIACYRLAVIRKPYDFDALREANSQFEQLCTWFPYEGIYKEYRDEIIAIFRSVV